VNGFRRNFVETRLDFGGDLGQDPDPRFWIRSRIQIQIFCSPVRLTSLSVDDVSSLFVPFNSHGSYMKYMRLLFTARCTQCKAPYCYLVPPSIRLWRWRTVGVCWTSSKLITRVISLRLRSSEPQHRQSTPRGIPPKFGRNRGGVALLSRKPAISLKRGKIGPRLLLMTNKKSHIRAIDWCQNQWPWMTLTAEFSCTF